MGQYHKLVNLDKHEWVDPHQLGCGLKVWEQLANHPSTGTALIILLAGSNGRGGGDLDVESNWHGAERDEAMKAGRIGGCTPGPMPMVGKTPYPEIAKHIVGRWCGDRIALIGDYGEEKDVPDGTGDLLYDACCDTGPGSKKAYEEHLDWVRQRDTNKADRLRELGRFIDVTALVCAVLEHELQGRFRGTGWRHWVESGETAELALLRRLVSIGGTIGNGPTSADLKTVHGEAKQLVERHDAYLQRLTADEGAEATTAKKAMVADTVLSTKGRTSEKKL